MKTVYYSFDIISGSDTWIKPKFPDDFYTDIVPYDEDSVYEHTNCPAWLEWKKNLWIVKQPFDLTIHFDSILRELSTNIDQDRFNQYFYLSHGWRDSELPVVQLQWAGLFWTNDKDVWVEQVPNPTLSRKGFELIPASFPVSVWLRPVVSAMRLLDFDTDLSINKGDDLYHLRFRSNNPKEKIILKKAVPTEKVIDKMRRDCEVKLWQKNYSWKLIGERLNNQSKCPFSKLFK
jgi:hypothetical protein